VVSPTDAHQVRRVARRASLREFDAMVDTVGDPTARLAALLELTERKLEELLTPGQGPRLRGIEAVER
jgi:hypothetical protein